MVLWFVFALTTAVVLAVILRPLFRPAPLSGSAGDANVAVYRDQLAEIDRERARGLVGPAEAEAAHAEIARRLLASAAENEPDPSSPPSASEPRLAGTAGVGLALAVPLLAIAVYLMHGSPGLPGSPLSARMQAPLETARVADLIARVETRLRQHPEDGQGWDVIAPVYMKQGRYREAADAYARAVELLGETPRRLAGLAEATVSAADGIVTDKARAAYERLYALEPSRVDARLGLAVASEQDGRFADASRAYELLLQGAEPDAPWRQVVEQRLADVRARLAATAGEASAKPAEAKGPTPEDVRAAAEMTPEARAAFIDQMVAGLAERLQKDGNDLAGWQRLIRAYAMLGRNGDAVGALAKARSNFQNNPQSLEALEALAKRLGLGS